MAEYTEDMHIQDRLRIMMNITIIHLFKDLILSKKTVKKKLRNCVFSTAKPNVIVRTIRRVSSDTKYSRPSQPRSQPKEF
jgi:hypothetical protein